MITCLQKVVNYEKAVVEYCGMFKSQENVNVFGIWFVQEQNSFNIVMRWFFCSIIQLFFYFGLH
jgi:hypothetical protein